MYISYIINFTLYNVFVQQKLGHRELKKKLHELMNKIYENNLVVRSIVSYFIFKISNI